MFKTIRKDSKKIIANHINNATKITLTTSYLDLFKTRVTTVKEITIKDVYDFIELKYFELEVKASYAENGELESVKFNNGYMYSDTIELTFEEVEAVEEFEEEYTDFVKRIAAMQEDY